jgi:hypothetical protein
MSSKCFCHMDLRRRGDVHLLGLALTAGEFGATVLLSGAAKRRLAQPTFAPTIRRDDAMLP